MENVLVSFIIIFLILFGMLTLNEVALSSQDMLRESWQDMQARWDDQARTSLQPVEGYTTSMGTTAVVVLRNNGTVSLSDFERWDAFLQYYDVGNPAAYHAEWLSYGSQNPSWSVAQIYLNTNEQTDELYEPWILNPDEEVVLELRSALPIGAGTVVQAVISTSNGVRTPILFKGNEIPVLAVNTTPVIATGKTITITNEYLQTTDADDSLEHLTYTIITPPTEGSLSFETSFTQADIDNEKLIYTHSGMQSDFFQFNISDGKDNIGLFTFSITVSAPPILAINSGLTMNIIGDTAAFDNVHLQVTDPDDPAENLVYTITRPPTQGTLSLSTSFTQTDVDSGLLTYSHTGTSSDSFEIAISDGETIIGPYDVSINVVP